MLEELDYKSCGRILKLTQLLLSPLVCNGQFHGLLRNIKTSYVYEKKGLLQPTNDLIQVNRLPLNISKPTYWLEGDITRASKARIPIIFASLGLSCFNSSSNM